MGDCGLRAPFPRLHCWQAVTRLSSVNLPPCERGTTWSTCSFTPSARAERPQYLQRKPSLSRMAKRSVRAALTRIPFLQAATLHAAEQYLRDGEPMKSLLHQKHRSTSRLRTLRGDLAGSSGESRDGISLSTASRSSASYLHSVEQYRWSGAAESSSISSPQVSRAQ